MTSFEYPYKLLLQPDLEMMVREGDGAGLGAFCQSLYPGVVAEVLDDLEPEMTWQVLSHCEPELQAEIFRFFPMSYQVRLVESIDREALSKIIEVMAPDDRVDLLERMDQDHVEALLPLIAQAERNDIRKLLSYPEDSAGSIMTTEYASLPVNITAGEALQRLRLQAPSRETIYYVYITDDQRRLVGFLSLRKLIQAKPDVQLKEIVQKDVIKVNVNDDQETVANELIRLGFIAMPVVDDDNRLVGIVTYDDAATILQEEATEDAHRLAAVEPLEDGYLDTSLWTLAWKRGIWLIILLGAAFVTAAVVKQFFPGAQSEQNTASWMVMFIPLVLASGGNSGSQSATLIIRMLALEESRGRGQRLVRQVFLREFGMGLLLGISIGFLAYLSALLLVLPNQSLVVGITVFLVVSFGAVTGALLPLALRAVGFDPALMSNPLISSLVDVIGIIIYSQTALVLLGTSS